MGSFAADVAEATLQRPEEHSTAMIKRKWDVPRFAAFAKCGSSLIADLYMNKKMIRLYTTKSPTLNNRW
jgi:hypothetical protein